MNQPSDPQMLEDPDEKPVKEIVVGLVKPRGELVDVEAPPLQRLHTYMSIHAMGYKGKGVVAKAKAPPSFPSGRMTTANFWFRPEALSLLGGLVYYVRLWEQGVSHIAQDFYLDGGDDKIDQITVRIIRSRPSTRRCWLTVTDEPFGNSQTRRSGALLLTA